MPTHRVITVIDEIPTFEKPLSEILSVLRVGGAIKTMTPLEHHTDRQRRWIKGVAIPTLAEWTGYTEEYIDEYLKKNCKGAELLKKQSWKMQDGTDITRFTIIGVGKRNMTKYIQEILGMAIDKEWPLDAPDPELRTL